VVQFLAYVSNGPPRHQFAKLICEMSAQNARLQQAKAGAKSQSSAIRQTDRKMHLAILFAVSNLIFYQPIEVSEPGYTESAHFGNEADLIAASEKK
jgi:hypothetical protein